MIVVTRARYARSETIKPYSLDTPRRVRLYDSVARNEDQSNAVSDLAHAAGIHPFWAYKLKARLHKQAARREIRRKKPT